MNRQQITHLSIGLTLSLMYRPSLAPAACQTNELSFEWPLDNRNPPEWVINNYVDLDAGSGLRDYLNSGEKAKTYNGHTGTDVDIPTTAYMFTYVPVRAAAPGVVVSTEDRLFDENMEFPVNCGPWNHVTIQHANGFKTTYGHLKAGSLDVQLGQQVSAGQSLASVGSSGCSTTAHLHFEVRDCQNNVVDPFSNGMWREAPPYRVPMRLMQYVVRNGPFLDSSVRPADTLLKDPGEYAAAIVKGGTLGIGASVAGGLMGERFAIRVLRPDGSVFYAPEALAANEWRHAWPRWWVTLPESGPGSWKIEFLINDQVATSHFFQIQSSNTVLIRDRSAQTYQHEFLSLTADGFQPVWVEASQEESLTHGPSYNAVFRKQAGPFRSYHAIAPSDYQGIFDNAVASGLQLLHVDNYLKNGQIFLAATFGAPIGGAWRAYHLASRDVHLQQFNNLRSNGYRPYAISVVKRNEQEYVSAAYTNLPSSGWTALYGLTADQYQQEFSRQQGMGRGLAYLDVYDNNGTPNFSAIWTVEANATPWAARHGLRSGEFYRYHQKMLLLGYNVKFVTSYLVSGERFFAGAWAK